MGFVETHRAGNTGIGKTLEDLLGIQENNIPGPDIVDTELKSLRRDSTSMMTLFTKEPPRDKQRLWGGDLVRKLGYTDDKDRPALKVTMQSDKPNSQGFYLRFGDDAVDVVHDEYGVCGTYPLAVLRNKFEDKFPAMVLVFADTKTTDDREHFNYNQAYHLDGFDGDVFLQLMRESVIKLDFRMHNRDDGSNRNRGTAWRILDERQLDRAFEMRTPLLDGNTEAGPSYSI
jgi:hypothetical protein